MAGWAPSLSAGAAVALPTAGRFSASTFLPDVRRFGATYFNYVGKPLAYILATPPTTTTGTTHCAAPSATRDRAPTWNASLRASAAR